MSRRAEETNSKSEYRAIYLGVANYGAQETNKNNRDSFTYRFFINGAEVSFKLFNGTPDDEGKYDYPIQNALKEGYSYLISVENGTVTAVDEIAEAAINQIPRVKGSPGKKTLKNFLSTALEPVGKTLYVYGGGWDWQDEGSAVQTRTIGVSSDWLKFFYSRDENYTFKEKDRDKTQADPAASYYPYGGFNEYYYAGLDCSGYLGWVIYNTFETKSGKKGYVGSSTDFAKRLSARGWGEWSQDIEAPDGKNRYTMKPGDIMSMNGHVWISLGTCADGSVVIAHSTPSLSRRGQPGGGVQISAIGHHTGCQAFALAEKYMSEEYPEWFARYPINLCNPEKYFAFEGKNAGKFTWNTAGTSEGLTDPDGIKEMKPEEVLAVLFGSNAP